MTRFRVTKKNVAKALDVESAWGFGWPVADDYEFFVDPLSGEETIRALGGYRYTTNKPLADGAFFLNFAKSGRSRGRLVSWVREFGLLTCENNKLGDPVPVRSFQSEAGTAERALTLYEAVRAGDAAAIRPRIELIRETNSGRPSPFAQVRVDGRTIPVFARADTALSRKEVLSIGVDALEDVANEKLREVRCRLGANFDHPRPLSPTHTPVVGWAIPDLLAALWFQFAMIVADSRPLKTCPYCGELYPPSRSTQETCGEDRCRKRASRHKKVQREK